MIPYKDGHDVGRLIPTGFLRHLVINDTPVDSKSFKGDIAHPALFVISIDDRHAGRFAIALDVAEDYVFNAASRSSAILLIVTDLHLQETTLMNLLDTDVLECDIAHQVVVAAINGHATLVIDLWFAVTQDIYILIA